MSKTFTVDEETLASLKWATHVFSTIGDYELSRERVSYSRALNELRRAVYIINSSEQDPRKKETPDLSDRG